MDYIVLAVFAVLILAALALIWRSRKVRVPPPPLVPGSMKAGDWEIGPVIGGKNHSVGLPLHPTASGEGWYFDFGEPHYVTRNEGPLTGKSRIRARFRVEGDGKLFGAGGEGPTAVTLYFAHRLNDWMNDGTRWWATFAPHYLLNVPDEFTIDVPLDAAAGWTSVFTLNSKDAPAGFNACKDDAGRIGFTFANHTGWGHGARAVGKVRFHCLEFSVE